MTTEFTATTWTLSEEGVRAIIPVLDRYVPEWRE